MDSDVAAAAASTPNDHSNDSIAGLVSTWDLETLIPAFISCFLISERTTATYFHWSRCCNNESGRAHYTGSRFEIEWVFKVRPLVYKSHNSQRPKHASDMFEEYTPRLVPQIWRKQVLRLRSWANSVEMRADGVLHTPTTTWWCSSTADTFKSTFQTIGTIKTPLNVSGRRHVVL